MTTRSLIDALHFCRDKLLSAISFAEQGDDLRAADEIEQAADRLREARDELAEAAA